MARVPGLYRRGSVSGGVGIVITAIYVRKSTEQNVSDEGRS